MTDDQRSNDLPPAFEVDAPPADEDTDQFGVGRLVGSAVPDETREARRRASEDALPSTDGSSKVDEASEESFPGSDPPSHTRTTPGE